MQKKIQKNCLVSEIIASEMAAVNFSITKGILVTTSQCVKKQF